MRDEAEDYARALEAAGVPVDLRRFDGFFHSTYNMGALVPRVQEIDAVVGDFLSSRLETARRPVSAGEKR